MELGPILRALMYNKTRFWLITMEVALTLAVVVNCVSMMSALRASFLRPSGLDVEHLLVLTTEPFGERFKDDGFTDLVREQDLDRLRSLPGVLDATAIDHVPLGGGGSITTRRSVPEDVDVSVPVFVVADNALEALGVELVAGRNFEPSDFVNSGSDEKSNNVILTQALADRLFDDGNAVGRQLRSGEGDVNDTVVGVIDKMHNAWPRSSIRERTMLRPGKPGYSREIIYLVRAHSGAEGALPVELENLALELNPERIVNVRSLVEVKRGYYQRPRVLFRVLGGVSVLLIGVTALGIIGLTSFSVTQRRREIGTRRALGATKTDVVRYFLVENWVITGIGLVLGAGLAAGLNIALVELAGAPKMDWSLLVAGALALWVAGLFAALAPALRATMVAPEVATRTV